MTFKKVNTTWYPVELLEMVPETCSEDALQSTLNILLP